MVAEKRIESFDLWIKSPYDGSIINWTDSFNKDSHKIERSGSIPICLTPDRIDNQYDFDPGYSLRDGIKFANEVRIAGDDFKKAVERLYNRRAVELGADVSYARDITAGRRVGTANQSIVDCCALIEKKGLVFPKANRVHVEIGCGMGFGIAASAKSYFGENVLGIDISPLYLEMTKLLLKENGISEPRLVCANICDGWPIPLEKYDVGFISAMGVLEHIKDVHAFFTNIQMIKSFPAILYMTVPYKYALQKESHFNLRGITWIPRRWQDKYIARKLNVSKIDHVEFYSKRSMKKLLGRYFSRDSIFVETNNRNPLKAHWLNCAVYLSGPESIKIG